MARSRITTLLLLLGCIVVGATGGIVLAARNKDAVVAGVQVPAVFNDASPLSVGTDSACAVVADGRIDCWGLNPDGILGVGTDPRDCQGYCDARPTALPGITRAVSVGTGDEFSCALLRSGTVKCWGANNYGQLGIGRTTGPTLCLVPGGTVDCSQHPVAVNGIRDAVSLGVGTASACAVLQSGGVYCWGAATDGALGNESEHGSQICGVAPTQEACSPAPVAVFGLGDAHQVSVGDLSACALVRGGRIVCWGDDGDAQLGDGTTGGPQVCGNSEPCSLIPVLVYGINTADSISVGSADACAVVDQDAVCWGDDSEGALGRGGDAGLDACGSHATPCAARPQRAAVPGRVTRVSAGDEDACALNRAGIAYCWGTAASGSLGIGGAGLGNCVGKGDSSDVPCVRTPTAVGLIAPVASVAAGYGSTCALGTNGSGYCWGENQTGQLGIGGNAGPGRCAAASGSQACATTPQDLKAWQ